MTMKYLMYGLREPLRQLAFGCGDGPHVEGTLQRFAFSCTSAEAADADYAQLLQLVSDLCDGSVTATWDVRACRERLHQLHHLLIPGPLPALFGMRVPAYTTLNRETLLGLLSLFEHLSASEHVWQFVHSHKEFVAADGLGYSGQFSDKVEDFLSQLGGEDYKVLDNFKPVVHWVAVLVAHQKQPFCALMRALASSQRVMEQARQPQESKPFSQLRTAEVNIDYICNLFHKGLGGLDAVLGQFQSIAAHCTYIFDLERAQLRLAYNDLQKSREVELSDAEVVDFQQRLGFIQHEEKAQGLSIMPYLGALEQHRRWLTLMCELRALGHRDWTEAVRTYSEGQQQPMQVLAVSGEASALQEADLASLPELLDTWKGQLELVVTQNPLLCLFSISAAQRLNDLVKQMAVKELALMLCPLCPRSVSDFEGMRACLTASASTSAEAHSSTDWPMRVASFLGEVMNRMGTSMGPSVEPTSPATCEGPTRYAAHPSHAAILRLLVHIFGAHCHAPQAYQVLWCDKTTTSGVLLSFLERARHHPARAFVLLQVELLAPALQHCCMRLFLDSRSAYANTLGDAGLNGEMQGGAGGRRAGHNVHCVETGASMLQSASWIPAVSAETVCGGIDLHTALRGWVFDAEYLSPSSVQCFCGAPGSGKTYQLRKSMAALPYCFTKCTVSITEAFDMGEAARKLQGAMLEASTKHLAIAFQINLGRFKHGEHEQWAQLMQRISKFFFSLLVLRSVEDSTTGCVFNIPYNCHLRVFVEIPDRGGHLEGAPSSALLDTGRVGYGGDSGNGGDGGVSRKSHPCAELPVLAVLGCCLDAGAAEFDVQEDAAHVTKYLSAYESGVIDQLYATGGGGRDMIFVLDNSGSMQG
ncbi:hypothetical protein B484DRAFT_405671, partial [Ochromonadaceae sp. CCMP2298]